MCGRVYVVLPATVLFTACMEEVCHLIEQHTVGHETDALDIGNVMGVDNDLRLPCLGGRVMITIVSESRNAFIFSEFNASLCLALGFT